MFPSSWFPPILAATLERQEVSFTMAGATLNSDELTEDRQVALESVLAMTQRVLDEEHPLLSPCEVVS